jgi:hypothetical protein
VSRCSAVKLAKVGRAMIKCPVDDACEAALTFSERLMRMADNRKQEVRACAARSCCAALPYQTFSCI